MLLHTCFGPEGGLEHFQTALRTKSIELNYLLSYDSEYFSSLRSQILYLWSKLLLSPVMPPDLLHSVDFISTEVF